MKITLHLEGSVLEIHEQIAEFAAALTEPGANVEAAPAPKKRGPKASAKKEEPAEDKSEEEDDGLGEEDEEFSLDEDAEEETPAAPTGKELLEAFKEFATAKPGNKEKAKKVLAKFKVSAVKDIPEGKRAEAMKLLGK